MRSGAVIILANGGSSTAFNFDYFDQWDGALLPAGRFETPFATTWNWTEIASGIASGGRYYSANSSNAMWHAFTSDAVTYQALTSNNAVTAEVSIDGITRGLVSLYNPTVITRTFDYGGLGIGPHVLQVRAVSGTATVDAFITAAFFPTATQRTVINYMYDGLYRLTKADSTGALTTTFEYAYDEANRLIDVGKVAYTWDDNGNLLNDGLASYQYDQANRLTRRTAGSLPERSATEYLYNGDGARLRVASAVCAELPCRPNVFVTYTQDLAAPLPVVLQSQTGVNVMQYVYALGTRPLAHAERGTAWEYLLADGLGSVRQIVDGDGNVTLAESYEPYGSVLSSNGTASSIFGYAGEQVDTSGLVFLRARYMQPTLGMFLSRDPMEIDLPEASSRWQYASQNPINRSDPSGWCAEKPAFFWNLIGVRVCVVESGDTVLRIASDYGWTDDPWKVVTFNEPFHDSSWLVSHLIMPGDLVYIPPRPQQQPPGPPEPPPAGPPQPNSTWLTDGFVEGWSNSVECVFMTDSNGEVKTICPGVSNCPEGVIGAGEGAEYVVNEVTREVAIFKYRYAIYGFGASLGKVKSERHIGFAQGFSQGLGFQDYSGLATCRSTSLTGQWKVLGIDSVLWWQEGGAIGLEAAQCGPGPDGPFEGLPPNGSRKGIWTVTMGISIYLTAFSTSIPTAVLAMYDDPIGIHRASDAEWAVFQEQMRDPKNSAKSRPR